MGLGWETHTGSGVGSSASVGHLRPGSGPWSCVLKGGRARDMAAGCSHTHYSWCCRPGREEVAYWCAALGGHCGAVAAVPPLHGSGSLLANTHRVREWGARGVYQQLSHE